MVRFEIVPGVTVQATSAHIGMHKRTKSSAERDSQAALPNFYAGLPSLSFRLHLRAGASGFASLSSALQPASQRNPVFSLAK